MPIGGRFQKINWNGEIIWDYILPEEICIPHHDIEVLPNGNILTICFEERSEQEIINKGKTNTFDSMTLDMIIEIEPQGNNEANIVWEWRFWDRLIQDQYNHLENYMPLIDNPGKIDINCDLEGNFYNQMTDWNHSNAIDYNPELDQILITSRRFNEIYIIDHSTTTFEAKNDFGGRYNVGGDFLYRWGNASNYGVYGSEKTLFSPHDANWIHDGYPGSGNILIFSNNHGLNNSAVIEIAPPINNQNTYDRTQGLYGPREFEWFYQSEFYSPTQSGVQRLPNGNTLITSTADGDIFEVDSSGIIHWNYSGDIFFPPRAIKYYPNLTHYTGDINSDGQIDIRDVVFISDLIINGDYNEHADFNLDYVLNVLDIVQIIIAIVE